MITRCGILDESKIYSYIGLDYPRCLYLYLDLKKYGFESETTKIYIQYDNGLITAVLLKYYSCLHVFSKDNSFNPNELASFIREHRFTIIYCPANTAEIVYSYLYKEINMEIILTTGWVAQIKKIDMEPRRISKSANCSDFSQIAKLIYDDKDIGRAYRFDELTKQLEERYVEGYSRNYVIKDEDVVIAHACTNAENERIAVVAELLVRKEYRRQGYAKEIWRDICDRLLTEGKEVYSFYYSEESRSLHKKIGFKEICRWGKVVISYCRKV